MNIKLSRARSALSYLAAYVGWPLLAAFIVIFKWISVPGCRPFDANDDAIFTFPSLYVSRSLLLKGQFPLINLMNNFGTPFIGDNLTFPFSLQSITYYFARPDVAMGINRFIFAFLTVLILVFYFSGFMKRFSASVCAVSVMFAQGFIWHFAHHNYQTSIFWCVALLIFQERYNKDNRFSYLLGLILCSINLFLGVSINIIFIIYLNLFVNQLFLSRFRIDRRMLLVGAALTAGVIVSLPELFFLKEAVQYSVRGTAWYGDNTPHFFLTAKISIVFLGLATAGIVHLWRRGGRFEACRLIVLGIVPRILVRVLLNNNSLWRAIPFLSSTDITRFWWISNIFMAVALGHALDSILIQSRHRGKKIFFAWFLIWAKICFRIFPKDFILYKYKYAVFFGMLCFVSLLLLINMLINKKKGFNYYLDRNHVLHYYAVGLFVIILQIGYISLKLFDFHKPGVCRSNHYYSPEGADRFAPVSFLEHIKPLSRIAVEEETFMSNEGMIIRENRLTSMGKTLFLNKYFADYLKRQNLISSDERHMTYHFSRPWDAKKLSHLGIKYVIQKNSDPALEERGWKLLDHEGPWSLYLNPVNTGLAYLADGEKEIPVDDGMVELDGNKININLKDVDRGCYLFATFLSLPGWEAYADGRREDIIEGEDKLLRIYVRPGTRKISFVFQPLFAVKFIFSSILGVLLPVLFYIAVNRPKK